MLFDLNESQRGIIIGSLLETKKNFSNLKNDDIQKFEMMFSKLINDGTKFVDQFGKNLDELIKYLKTGQI